jgi:hypothetical protein
MLKKHVKDVEGYRIFDQSSTNNKKKAQQLLDPNESNKEGARGTRALVLFK